MRRHYRRGKTITLILDIYIIHKSKQTERWLKKNPRFCRIFQPVTCHHQYRGMANLLARVKHFMGTVSPFSGNGYETTKM
ncbi:hypothetical protein B1L08_20780 [Aeromonas veronii]|nr:hypothetical protein [Aeromonas veronii]